MTPKYFSYLILCIITVLVISFGHTLFNNFFAKGSVISVLLMTYTASVCYEVVIINRHKATSVRAPLLVTSAFSSIFILFSVPCIIWPAIYIGLYDGFLAGAISFLILQAYSGYISKFLGIRGPHMALHFVVAVACCFLGYYLSYTSIPST